MSILKSNWRRCRTALRALQADYINMGEFVIWCISWVIGLPVCLVLTLWWSVKDWAKTKEKS